MEIDTIYNMDCLEGMKMIPDGSVDCIICDLPYGTMKGIDDKHDWDVIIPTDKLFSEYERVLRRGGTAILFSQEPYTSHLRTFKPRNVIFAYPMIWKKDTCGNALYAKNAPCNYFEDINIFVKDNDSHFLHPLRKYFALLNEYAGGHQNILKKHGGQGGPCMHAFGCLNNSQFGLCTRETYEMVTDEFGFRNMDGFKEYDELLEIDKDFKIRFAKTFNLPEGRKSMSNVLEFSKDTDGFHPTQKPVALIRRLIQTYSNEGDTILDNCMGSGTTAIASIREKRHFIGFELNAEYYEKAMQRIKLERQQLTLF